MRVNHRYIFVSSFMGILMMSLANGASSRQTVIVLTMVISLKPRIAFSLKVFQKTNKVSGDMSHISLRWIKEEKIQNFGKKLLIIIFGKIFTPFSGRG